MSEEIKIESGKKREFSTGAERQASEGKGTPVLIPGDAIIDIAKHFEKGVDVYGARNWEKGLPLSELLNSLERHLQQLKMGMTDEPHARALAWNAVVYLATKLRIENGLLPAELDDMPVYTTLEERLDKEEIGVTEEVAKEFNHIETIEEVLAVNEELAEGLDFIPFADEPVKEFKDTMTSWAHNDGQWYCSEFHCHKRGFSNVAPNTFYCKDHIDKGRKEYEDLS